MSSPRGASMEVAAIPGTSRARLRDLLKVEQERFDDTHPGSVARHRRARAAMPLGVPMLWMLAWAGSAPIYVARASGAHLTDVDGNDYVDFCLGDTGAMTGHAPGRAVDVIRER